MENTESPQKGVPYKITDHSRETRKGVVATSLEDLTSKLSGKFVLSQEDDIKVVLEADGTEVDDEEYFATLEPHTSLMILTGDQRWAPWSPPCKISLDQVDDSNGMRAELAGLVDRLHHDIRHVSVLNGPELELLSDMDPDSLADITYPDKMFLEQLKEVSGRYLSDKRQAQDALDLLQIYNSGKNSTDDNSQPKKERV